MDAAAVTEQVRTVLRERPTWRAPTPDLGSGARAESAQQREVGLADLLKPGAR